MKTQNKMQIPSVVDKLFEYDNYREFLVEYFKEQKNQKPFFSHRFFAKKAGFTSPSFLIDVMRGKRNLTLRALEKLHTTLGLKSKSAAYFKTLVLFNQAKTPSDRMQIYEELLKLRRRFTAKQLASEQFEYFAHWYNPVIRELVSHSHWKGNYKSLGELLLPPISAEKAMQAVASLSNMGLVQKNSNKSYIQASQAVLADHVPVANRRHFRMEMLVRAMEALEWSNPNPKPGPKTEHFSGTTVAMSESNFQKLSLMIDEFRKKILESAIEDEKVERVYQFSFLAFPVSMKLTSKPDLGFKK